MNRGRGGFRGGRGGRTGPSQFQQGPPDTVLEMGEFSKPVKVTLSVVRSIQKFHISMHQFT